MTYLALQLPGVDNGSVKIIPPAGIMTGGQHTLNNIISTGIELAVVAAIFVCLLMLILGGFEWIFSQGDKQKVAQARQRLTMSVIGLILIFLSFMIINILYGFFRLPGNFLGNLGS
ncbi:MAG TPA: pilin [Patescibacteria group bacterium]|jgi:fatty acid desaturase|nr:pilin [Patescibacteria group bacterium]